jgi:hypothetical protein
VPIGAQDLIRLSSLLEQALTLAPAARASWLAQLPEADRHLEVALRRMFSAEGEAQPRLATLPRLQAGPEREDDTTAQVGDSVGPYRLLRPVARGGMGSVWLAERADGALHRQVALKLPHLAWGAGLAERMARERDIGARLEHPHIARLYDAGLDDRGRPFLAFEFIDGVSIDAWCRDHALSTRARLRLFLQVAQAVAYAHTRLVVHRDLKPSNVMVTADAQVHLLDFGVAKLLQDSRSDDTGLTQRLGQAMTPHYASPEQLRGEAVTVASDVYSLGVMLYELLTDQRPHAPRRASVAALEEAILQGEPLPASRRVGDRVRARALQGDVDAILAKALRRDIAHRYATVDAMAADVQRHLAGEPVLARHATAFYRWGKWVGRHPMLAAAGATAAFTAMAAAAAMVAQAQRATAQAEQAALVKQFVIDAFKASAQDDEVDARGRTSSLERLVERNAQLIARANDPELEAELYGIVANILLDANSFAMAAHNARRQVAALDRLGAPAAQRADAALLLAKTQLSSGDDQEARVQARRALELTSDPAMAARARLLLSAALAAGGSMQTAVGTELDRVDAALAAAASPMHAERARALALRAWVVDGADTDGDGRQATELLERAVDVASSGGGPASHLAGELRLELARHLVLHRRSAEAGAVLSRGHRPGQEGVGRALDPETASLDVHLANAELGALVLSNGTEHGAMAKALAEVERSHEVIIALGARVSPLQRAWADAYAAEAALARGHHELAQALSSQASAALLPLTHGARARLQLLAVSARAAVGAGRAAQAETMLREWQALALRHSARQAWRAQVATAEHLVNLARWDEAEAALAAITPASGVAGATTAPAVAAGNVRLRAWLDRGDPTRALAVAERLAGQADPVLRSEALCAAGRVREGLSLLEQSTSPSTGIAPYPYSPAAAQRLAVQGLCHLAMGDHQRATGLARRARATFEAQAGLSTAYRRPLDRLDSRLKPGPARVTPLATPAG